MISCVVKFVGGGSVAVCNEHGCEMYDIFLTGFGGLFPNSCLFDVIYRPPDTFTFDVKFFILPSGNRTSEFPFVVFALITDTFDISIILPLFENNLGVMPLDNLTFSKTLIPDGPDFTRGGCISV
jgi:hypothetical protein